MRMIENTFRFTDIQGMKKIAQGFEKLRLLQKRKNDVDGFDFHDNKLPTEKTIIGR